MRNIITLSSDINYLDYSINLIESINRHIENIDVLYRCVDFTQDQQDDMMCLKNEHMHFIFDNVGLSNKKTILKDIGRSLHYSYNASGFGNIKNFQKVLYSERSVYTCHSRFKNILKCLDDEYSIVIALDSDTVVNKDFSHIFEFVNSHDLCVVGEQNKATNSIEYFKNEGLLMINNTHNSRNYFQLVHDYIFYDDRYKQWNVDSEAMNHVYSENTINIGLLDTRYKDREACDESYMWSGDSINKYKYKFNERTSNMDRLGK